VAERDAATALRGKLLKMDARLLRGALWRRRGTAGLAVLAVTIGASVASALLHVQGDVSRKLTRELRKLGPNLLVVAAPGAPGLPQGATAKDGGRFLDERTVRVRLAAAGVEGVPLLFVAARAGNIPVQVIGTDLEAARRLHPSWHLAPGLHPSWIGMRLARRAGIATGARVRIESLDDARAIEVVAGPSLEAGGPDDEAWWIPLAEAQRLGGLAGRVSVAQARIEGDARAALVVARVIEEGGSLAALPLHALTATEGLLLERMRRLMALVTIAALVAAGLCAFGSLTDLALERRREIALMKALGATQAEVVRQFAVESIAIGVIGGVAGWLLGLGMAEIIGKEVFHAVIVPRWEIALIVMALSLLVAGIASLGPVKLALGVEPALALKGD
jgi:putative ABC transport system permease protein